jgi:hypothetical protein
VPRMRHIVDVSSWPKPVGTEPPCVSISSTLKSTRKLAQHAPQLVQADMLIDARAAGIP